MKHNTTVIIAWSLMLAAIIAIYWIGKSRAGRSSSFVGYSQSCWQVGDTLHVVTAKGDTVRLDVLKLNQ